MRLIEPEKQINKCLMFSGELIPHLTKTNCMTSIDCHSTVGHLADIDLLRLQRCKP